MYFTVLIPYEPRLDRRTDWHPTESVGPFATLTRGAFRTASEAVAWARRNLGQTRYYFQEVAGDVVRLPACGETCRADSACSCDLPPGHVGYRHASWRPVLGVWHHFGEVQ